MTARAAAIQQQATEAEAGEDPGGRLGDRRNAVPSKAVGLGVGNASPGGSRAEVKTIDWVFYAEAVAASGSERERKVLDRVVEAC